MLIYIGILFSFKHHPRDCFNGFVNFLNFVIKFGFLVRENLHKLISNTVFEKALDKLLLFGKRKSNCVLLQSLAMQQIGIEDFQDLNSVEMSNERLLRLEASEILSLREVITWMWRLETDLKFDERQLNLSTPLSSTLETLRHILKRQVALNDLRYALMVFARPVVLFLALLLELLALGVLVRLTCARKRHRITCAESSSSTYSYLVLHVAACTIEDALFHAPEWLAFAFGVRHPATAHRLLCSFWWLGFNIIHAFPLWILLPVAFRAGIILLL